MVKVKYKGTGLRSKGIQFVNGTYTVDPKIAEYLLATFPKWFTKVEEEVIKVPIPVEDEDNSEEPKTILKRKPKAVQK
jgi:hypothetical protein